MLSTELTEAMVDDASLDVNLRLELFEFVDSKLPVELKDSVCDEVTRADKPLIPTVGPELDVAMDETLFELGFWLDKAEIAVELCVTLESEVALIWDILFKLDVELKSEVLDPISFELESESDVDWMESDAKSFELRVRLVLEVVLSDEI